MMKDTNQATLETAINAFLPTTTTVISVEYAVMFKQFLAGVAVLDYSVCIVYT